MSKRVPGHFFGSKSCFPGSDLTIALMDSCCHAINTTPLQAWAAAATLLSSPLAKEILILRRSFLLKGRIVSCGLLLFDSTSLPGWNPASSPGVEANRNCGRAIKELCRCPSWAENKHASAPARCQPRTIRSCLLFLPV